MYHTPRYLLKHEYVIPVSIHDTDAMGVVWHGNYLRYFESAREDLFLKLGYDYNAFCNENFSIPVTECRCCYRHPLRLTDREAKVYVMLLSYDSKLEISYEIYTANMQHLCAYGHTQHVITLNDSGELLFELPEKLSLSITSAIKAYKAQEDGL